MDRFKDKVIGLKGLASIGFGDVFGTGITALFWFYIASILEVGQYGEIHYFLGIAGIAYSISLIGSPHVITVYTAKNIKIQSTLYLLALIVGTISAVTILIIFYRVDASFIVLGYIIGALALAELLGRKMYNLYAKYVVTQKILTVVFGLGLYYLIGIEGIIYGLALSYVPYLIRIISEFKSSKVDFSKLKPHKHFITNNYALGLADGFRNNIDKLIIVPLLGFSILGNYSLSLQIITVMLMFSSIVFKFILPEDASGNPNKKLKILTVFIAIGIAGFGILIMPMVIPVFFPKYTEAVDAIQIMSLGVVSSTVSLIYWSKLLGLEKSKFLLISRSMMVSTMIIGILILGPLFNIVGVAIAWVLSSTIEATFLSAVCRRVK